MTVPDKATLPTCTRCDEQVDLVAHLPPDKRLCVQCMVATILDLGGQVFVVSKERDQAIGQRDAVMQDNERLRARDQQSMRDWQSLRSDLTQRDTRITALETAAQRALEALTYELDCDSDRRCYCDIGRCRLHEAYAAQAALRSILRTKPAAERAILSTGDGGPNTDVEWVSQNPAAGDEGTKYTKGKWSIMAGAPWNILGEGGARIVWCRSNDARNGERADIANAAHIVALHNATLPVDDAPPPDASPRNKRGD